MKQRLRSFCAVCAPPILEQYRGWPNRNYGPATRGVPLLPRVHRGRCEFCGLSGETIESWRIRWGAVQSEFSTGLPDFWILGVEHHRDWTLDVAAHADQPYFSEAVCPECQGRTIVSRKSDELARNCPECGVRVLRAVPSVPYLGESSVALSSREPHLGGSRVVKD